MKIAILTSPHQWFECYAQELSENLGGAPIYLDHTKIDRPFDVLFILSYHKIIEKDYLLRHRHNIVIHGSDLPAGKGWAPLFWQVIEGKNEIVFTMFEAGEGVDNGDIYMKETLRLTGYELNTELRQKQAELIIKMCQKFVNEYDKYKTPTKQIGEESFYPKRTAMDSELDVHKTMIEQFNLLRTVNNQNYPAFFELDGHRYRLTIELETALGGGAID
jgi:methionyl-tRNA formyltransferase